MIIHTNKASAFIDRQVHSDQVFSFVKRINGDKIIIDFQRNTINGMHMKPSRTISRITPNITSLERGTGIRRKCGAGRNSSDRIPPRNIGRSGLFDRGTSDLSNRSASWHGALKSESENSGDNSIF